MRRALCVRGRHKSVARYGELRQPAAPLARYARRLCQPQLPRSVADTARRHSRAVVSSIQVTCCHYYIVARCHASRRIRHDAASRHAAVVDYVNIAP